jgi:hypothetical protein
LPKEKTCQTFGWEYFKYASIFSDWHGVITGSATPATTFEYVTEQAVKIYQGYLFSLNVIPVTEKSTAQSKIFDIFLP